MVLKFECVLESHRGLAEGRISKPHLQNCDSVGLGAALEFVIGEFVFLLSSQARLVLPALQPKLKNIVWSCNRVKDQKKDYILQPLNKVSKTVTPMAQC